MHIYIHSLKFLLLPSYIKDFFPQTILALSEVKLSSKSSLIKISSENLILNSQYYDIYRVLSSI